MKRQYFISLFITCMVIFNVKAQNTPIDDFLKKYPSREGVTHVTISQQMLQSIFAPSDDVRVIGVGLQSKQKPSTQASKPASESAEVVVSATALSRQDMNVPEAYSSVSVSKTDIPTNLSSDLKKTLLSSKYEQHMEMNKENIVILGYYLKKVNDKCNEIVVLRQENDQFSAIYIRGEIDINELDRYLTRIRIALNRQMITKHVGLYEDSETVYSGNAIQNIPISGIITDTNGNTLPGMNVVIKGTTQGTITDANGAYLLSVPDENARLVFSFRGYATQEILVGSQRDINVTLSKGAR